MSRATVRVLLTIALSLSCALPARAIERGPLPSFALRTSDGGTITSNRLVRSGQWLVVVVRPDCPPCDAVLRAAIAASAASNGPFAAKLVIIVVGDNAALAASVERFAALAGASWLADPDGGGVASMKVPDAPTIVGLRGGTIEWSVGGVLTDSPDVRSIISSWTGNGSERH